MNAFIVIAYLAGPAKLAAEVSVVTVLSFVDIGCEADADCVSPFPFSTLSDKSFKAGMQE